jgi:hypothetical protein
MTRELKRMPRRRAERLLRGRAPHDDRLAILVDAAVAPATAAELGREGDALREYRIVTAQRVP